MKFGHYIQGQRKGSFFQGLSTESDLFWVDYKLLKKSIKNTQADNDGDFVNKWETQLTSLASTIRNFNSDDNELVQEYVRINREALRKSAKKYDKKVASPLGFFSSERLLTHMADYILKTCSALLVVIEDEPSAPESEKHEHPKRWYQRYFTKKNFLQLLFVVVFTCIVSGESIAYKQAKLAIPDGSILCVPTVVLIESVASIILGSILCLWCGGRERMCDSFRLKRLRSFAPAGITRSCGDICTVLVISYIDPSTYMVVSQSKLLVTGLLAYILLPTHPNSLQWYALMFIAIGIIIFKFSHDGSSSTTESTYIGFLLLAGSVLCKGFASSWMDRELKKGADESTISQSVSISVTSLIPSAIFFWAVGHTHIDNPVRGVTAFTVMLGIYLLVKNWYGSFIIKSASAVVKYILYAVAVLLTYATSVLFFEEEFHMVALLAAVVVCSAVLLYGSAKTYVKVS